MKSFILIFTALIGLTTQAQDFNIDWSTLERSTARLLDVDTRNANDFFALRRTSGMFGKLQVSSHKNLELIHRDYLELRTPDGSMATYEGSSLVNNRFVVFLSDKTKDQNIFYLQEYGDDLTPLSEPVELARYTMERKSKKFSGSFNYYLSEDRNSLAVVWTIPGKRDEYASYGYKVFNKDLELIHEGDYEVPYQDKFSTIGQFYLTNSGELFVTITEYKQNEHTVLKRYDQYVAAHVFHLSAANEQKQMTIDLEGRRAEGYTMTSDNNNVFVFTGIYGAHDKAGVTGVFYLKMDFETQEILGRGYEEFGEDFITQDWSDRQKKKYDKKKEKGKDVNASLYSYKVRENYTLEDGSLIGSIEQYYVRVVSNYNAQNNMTTYTYYYYYNDIITYKVGADGGFDWMTKTDKYQVSANDGGYFSSFSQFVSDGKLYFIFNDHTKNYDETSGEFLSAENIRPASYSKKRNVVALTSIDLETGRSERKVFFDRSEIDAVAVPKHFNTDYNNNELLIYTIRRKKEKFGILRF